jgi:hypothetical protein
MTALLAPAAMAALQNWTWNTNDIKEDDYPGRHLNYNEILCEHCKEHVHTDSKFNVSITDYIMFLLNLLQKVMVNAFLLICGNSSYLLLCHKCYSLPTQKGMALSYLVLSK